jgi:2-polyprenyl-3-methyl-5-hydroxy-6-metoxy-1,4-benzoquinol methylase
MPTLRAGAVVLDVGCGHGSVSQALVEKGFEVYGMEINQEALESLRSRGIKAIERDLTAPFKLDTKFDLILLLDVLEHVFDPLSVLQEAARNLKPGGELILHVPLYFDIIDRLKILFTGNIISYDNLTYGYENYRKFRSFNYDHIRFFRPKDILELCQLAGLQIQVTHYGPLVGLSRLPGFVRKVLSSQAFIKLWPNGFAHFMGVRVSRLG